MTLRVHLVDGTYELFRSFFGAPSATAPDGREVGAVRGIARTLLALMEPGRIDGGATHVAIAFDTVIESFRNTLYEGYKTGAGLDPTLLGQFPLAERMARALGFVTWSMIDFEADDAIATMAERAKRDPIVSQVVICSPDKDLAQCADDNVVLLDRRRKTTLDVAGVHAKFGVKPESIPDFLALVGDTADGFPGIPRWGEKSAAKVLDRWLHLHAIPERASEWDVVGLRGADALAESLREHRELALLFRTLATLRLDVPLDEEVAELLWRGADRAELERLAQELGDSSLVSRVPRWRD